MLKAQSITHRFGNATVLEAVDLTVLPGEIVGLCGPSGAGKSTLGRILAGHVQPTRGDVTLEGAPIAHRVGRPCAVQYAPQASELSLDPRWRVARILRNGGAVDPAVLRLLGIRPDWDDRFPAELSGGELARVSLARLLLPTTRYLICDEITAPLDALAATEMVLTLRRLCARRLGLLLISHNRRQLQRHVDRCFELDADGLRPMETGHTEPHALHRG
jgi:peptide/nickel transport system ATP-binding protein